MKMFPRVLSIVALAALTLASNQCRRAKQVPSTAKEGGAQSPAAAKVIKATKDQPYVNSLGMKFVPVQITGGASAGQQVLFCIWETRVGDYASFVEASKDSYGNVLADGDIVAMIKDLKLKGSSDVLKVGTKSKPIRLVDGDHEISCKMDGITIGLKACFVKKVVG